MLGPVVVLKEVAKRLTGAVGEARGEEPKHCGGLKLWGSERVNCK